MRCASIFEKELGQSQVRWRLLLGSRDALDVVMQGKPLCGFHVNASLNVGDRYRRRRFPVKRDERAETDDGDAIPSRMAPESAHGYKANIAELHPSTEENPAAALEEDKPPAQNLKSATLPLADCLAPDSVVEPASFELHLAFLRETQENTSWKDTTVLVNCNLCINRSPTLVLLFLVLNERLSLRDSYRHLFHAGHRCIDPLPPYRRMLVEAERTSLGSCSIGEGDWFAFHFTDPVFGDMEFEAILEKRDKSIAMLLAEKGMLGAEVAGGEAATEGRDRAPARAASAAATSAAHGTDIL
mmetsp:Transcript_47817/g.113195  ORF Transcript_47817/g.113195 Transcript_47817/m.113195 type:complete len:300 (+) Transcript_47817:26-925(+)